MAKIGVIGLGNMGLPMAGNLVKKGHEVQGFDLVPANMGQAAVGRGVTQAAARPTDAAKDVDVVVTMLPAGKHVLEVYGSGMLQAAKPGTLFIDCSTIDVASARGAHKLAADAKMLSLDAPVSAASAARRRRR